MILAYYKRQLPLTKKKLKSQSREICWASPWEHVAIVKYRQFYLHRVLYSWDHPPLHAALVGQPIPDVCSSDSRGGPSDPPSWAFKPRATRTRGNGSRASSDGSTTLEAGLRVLAAEAPSCPGSCLPQGLFGQLFPQFLFLLIIYKALYDHRCWLKDECGLERHSK